MQINEVELLLIQGTKINSKWIKYLNVRPKIITLLEENIKGKHDIALGNGLLDISPKTWKTKEKEISWTTSKLSDFVYQRRQSTE